MRLPRKVRINNIPFKVVRDKTSAGCSFSYDKLLIEVGTKCNSSREMLTGLLHEVAEISAVERGVRNSKCRPQATAHEYVFHASHKDFSDMVSDISGVVGDMMKLE